MTVKVNRWLDLLDRVGWTALQAAGGAVLTFATNGGDWDWGDFGRFVLFTTAIAVAKVVVGQNTGNDNTGSLIGKSVVKPPPTS